MEAVRNWPTPTTVKPLRGFLGLAGYYRRCIQGFDIICKPLPNLLKKDGFKLSPTASVAFDQLKEALTKTPILVLPNIIKIFIVEIDASGYGIGAILMQQGHLITVIYKALSPRHATLSIYDRELLVIVHAVTKWS